MIKQKQYWPDNTIYFLTSSTFLHYPYFKDDVKKQILLNQFRKIKDRCNVKINSYSISINHFHLKFFLKDGLLMPKIKQLLHGGTSFEYKKKFRLEMKYKNMWQSSKLYQITSELMDWKVTGYIIGNLLKHKEVSTFRELKQNRFSSYWYYANKYGDDFAENLVRTVIDVKESNKGEVDFDGLTT